MQQFVTSSVSQRPRQSAARRSVTKVFTLAASLCFSLPVSCTPQQFRQRALNGIRLPWSIGAAQLIVGALYVLPLWKLNIRDAPRLTMDNVVGLIPIAICHVLSHVCITMGHAGIAGGVCGDS